MGVTLSVIVVCGAVLFFLYRKSTHASNNTKAHQAKPIMVNVCLKLVSFCACFLFLDSRVSNMVLMNSSL